MEKWLKYESQITEGNVCLFILFYAMSSRVQGTWFMFVCHLSVNLQVNIFVWCLQISFFLIIHSGFYCVFTRRTACKKK